jgi:predicted lactoylglutathione lyase
MHKQIFVNLPIKDMARSQAFFRALGYEFDDHFTNDKGAALVLGENLYAMLLVEDFFKGFTGKPIADATQSTEVLVCLSCDSRAQVDAQVAKALAAGGTAPRPPQDHGFMYAHGFEDLDGHIWELVFMDASAAANPTQDA